MFEDLFISARRADSDVARRMFDDDTRYLLKVNRPAETVKAANWETWVPEMFPGKATFPFADHHIDLWQHAMRLEGGINPGDLEPFIAIWPRAGGKTTNLEMIAARLLATGSINYLIIACSTLARAQDRVRGIRAILESNTFRRKYPLVGLPKRTRAGTTNKWTSSLLHTASDQIIQAVSLGSDVRGLNAGLEDVNLRPDCLFVDDVDKTSESKAAIKGKIDRLTRDILPTGGERGLAVFGVQNLIRADGMFGQLRDGVAPFAQNRILSGPIPALIGLQYTTVTEKVETEIGGEVSVRRFKLTAGTPTWEGQDLEKCQALADNMGITAFLNEMQHEVDHVDGAMLSPEHFEGITDLGTIDLGKIQEKIVTVDPSGGAVDHGIAVSGLIPLTIGDSKIWLFVLLEDATVPGSEDWASVAVRLGNEYRCGIVIESNYGGSAMIKTAENARKEMFASGQLTGYKPSVAPVHASLSKRDRAQPLKWAIIDGKVRHAREFPQYIREWTTQSPEQIGKDSPNRLDAVVHGFNHLQKLVTKPKFAGFKSGGHGIQV